jgi:tetratricopeptide (TPR) repeat protein
MHSGRTAALGLLLLVGLTARVQAQSAEDVSRAKTHFEAARALYSLGNYESALREFTSGYTLVPKPRFLLNIGHCHRKLSQFDKAREAYQRFLAEVPADDPDRAEAQRYLTEVENAPPPVTPPTVVTPVVATSQPVITSVPVDKKMSKLKLHLAWGIPVGAAVVVGLALGIYFGTRGPTDCDGATPGWCFTVTR